MLLLFVALGGFYVSRHPDAVRAAVGGVITISARITGATFNAPIGDNDAATKGYVGTQSGSVVAFRLSTSGAGCPVVTGATCRAEFGPAGGCGAAAFGVGNCGDTLSSGGTGCTTNPLICVYSSN